MILLEFHVHMFSCNACMTITITKWHMKNFMNVHKLNIMIYDADYYLHFQSNSQYTIRLWL